MGGHFRDVPVLIVETCFYIGVDCCESSYVFTFYLFNKRRWHNANPEILETGELYSSFNPIPCWVIWKPVCLMSKYYKWYIIGKLMCALLLESANAKKLEILKNCNFFCKSSYIENACKKGPNNNKVSIY